MLHIARLQSETLHDGGHQVGRRERLDLVVHVHARPLASEARDVGNVTKRRILRVLVDDELRRTAVRTWGAVEVDGREDYADDQGQCVPPPVSPYHPPYVTEIYLCLFLLAEPSAVVILFCHIFPCFLMSLIVISVLSCHT